jgi:dihydroorotase
VQACLLGPRPYRPTRKWFDEENGLDRLEVFASLNDARFYGLPPNGGSIQPKRSIAAVPLAIRVEDDEVIVFRGSESLSWSIGDTNGCEPIKTLG